MGFFRYAMIAATYPTSKIVKLIQYISKAAMIVAKTANPITITI
jgi:hypothetical protein